MVVIVIRLSRRQSKQKRFSVCYLDVGFRVLYAWDRIIGNAMAGKSRVEGSVSIFEFNGFFRFQYVALSDIAYRELTKSSEQGYYQLVFYGYRYILTFFIYRAFQL